MNFCLIRLNEQDDDWRSASDFALTDVTKIARWVYKNTCGEAKSFHNIAPKVCHTLLRQSNGTPAAWSSGAEALYSDLQCYKGQRGDVKAGALAGCPKPDPADLPTWPKRQCKRAATCGACAVPKRHLINHHPKSGLQRWGLLHLHFWHAPIWIEAGTNLP